MSPIHGFIRTPDDDDAMPTKRKNLMPKIDDNLYKTLVIFEAALSVIFLCIGYYTNSMYLRGVGIGLLIAWATNAIAYLKKGLSAKR